MKDRDPIKLTVAAADIANFAQALGRAFRIPPMQALAEFIRRKPEFEEWRSAVEWCPICKTYQPIQHQPTADFRRPAPAPNSAGPWETHLVEHDDWRTHKTCAGTNRTVIWTGRREPLHVAITDDALLETIKYMNATR